jgi:hypothetical protein
MVEKETWALPLETGVGVNALPKRRNDYRGVHRRIMLSVHLSMLGGKSLFKPLVY